jgi:hypothetical protein
MARLKKHKGPYDVSGSGKSFQSCISTTVFEGVRDALEAYEQKFINCIEKPKLTEADIFHAVVPDHMKDSLLAISQYTGVPDRQEVRFAIPVWVREYEGWPEQPTFKLGDDHYTIHDWFPNPGANQSKFQEQFRSLFGIRCKIRSFLTPLPLRTHQIMNLRCSVGDQLRAYAKEVNAIQYEMARVMCVFRVMAEHFSTTKQILFHWPALQMILSDEACVLNNRNVVRAVFAENKGVTIKSNVIPRHVMEAVSETLTKAIMVAKFGKGDAPVDEHYGSNTNTPIVWSLDVSNYQNIWKRSPHTVNNT